MVTRRESRRPDREIRFLPLFPLMLFLIAMLACFCANLGLPVIGTDFPTASIRYAEAGSVLGVGLAFRVVGRGSVR